MRLLFIDLRDGRDAECKGGLLHRSIARTPHGVNRASAHQRPQEHTTVSQLPCRTREALHSCMSPCDSFSVEIFAALRREGSAILCVLHHGGCAPERDSGKGRGHESSCLALQDTGFRNPNDVRQIIRRTSGVWRANV